ncbi:hypothetical protein CYMTET_12963 [Cymbomonas tetramitiformis]|uniref:Uncharacterized protein n=1 Tax=Cymbomonas tetramitiformis TaxID=36881 RepID=A0AAE0LBN6_9CHLO|nr:hypothetical protein CYMTET_12963 [Cymbomonas tetramitiformis]
MKPVDSEENGKMAPRFVWFLKSTELHDDPDGAVNCAEEPFHQMKRGSTWRVARPATVYYEEGEVSDEYLHNGNSLRGLMEKDGFESTMNYWALRKFVYELNKRVPYAGHQGEERHGQSGSLD